MLRQRIIRIDSIITELDAHNEPNKWHKHLFISNFIFIQIRQDTRTHVVVELFNTEKSYVESLETVVNVSGAANGIFSSISTCWILANNNK